MRSHRGEMPAGDGDVYSTPVLEAIIRKRLGLARRRGERLGIVGVHLGPDRPARDAGHEREIERTLRDLAHTIVTGVRVLSTKLGGLYARLQAAQKQRAAVAQLMALDERMLQDIGLNRSLVPFAVTGVAQSKALDLYADVGVGLTANDNGLRHAA